MHESTTTRGPAPRARSCHLDPVLLSAACAGSPTSTGATSALMNPGSRVRYGDHPPSPSRLEIGERVLAQEPNDRPGSAQ
jgi:hypothetical protein